MVIMHSFIRKLVDWDVVLHADVVTVRVELKQNAWDETVMIFFVEKKHNEDFVYGC